MKTFASDNCAGVVPEVMQALQKANSGHARSYGADPISAHVTELLREKFADPNAQVCFVFNGTGANVLSVSSATQSYNAVLCADTAHLYHDESSAPETFTGCRFLPLTVCEEGKLKIDAIADRLGRKGDIHCAQANLLSITQTTEYGTIYTPQELRRITELAHAEGLYVHMDGARFMNAAAALNCDWSEISVAAGIDVLSLGGTKAGMMFGEAVVIFNDALKQHITFKHKQSMQLASKTRFIAAQFEALLVDDVWRKYALHAHEMAALLGNLLAPYPQFKITKPIQSNALFATLPPDWIRPLQDAFPFYVWDERSYEIRLMCAFDTTTQDVYEFVAHVDKLALGKA